MTTSELADLLGWSPARTLELLAESAESGIIERSPTGWKLTEGAEARYGDALRGLAPLDPDHSEPAARRDRLDAAA